MNLVYGVLKAKKLRDRDAEFTNLLPIGTSTEYIRKLLGPRYFTKSLEALIFFGVHGTRVQVQCKHDSRMPSDKAPPLPGASHPASFKVHAYKTLRQAGVPF